MQKRTLVKRHALTESVEIELTSNASLVAK